MDRVLVILFCNLAYWQYPGGTTSLAQGWNDQMCRDIARTDPVAGDPSYCWQDGKKYPKERRSLCRPKTRP